MSARDEKSRTQSTSSLSSSSGTERQSKQNASAPIQPEELSGINLVSNLDVTLDSAVNPLGSYAYELQGELLRRPQEQGEAAAEFSMPYAGVSVGPQWLSPGVTVGAGGTTSPTQLLQPSNGSASTAGSKRKSVSGSSGITGASKPESSKRPSRSTAEPLEKPASLPGSMAAPPARPPVQRSSTGGSGEDNTTATSSTTSNTDHETPQSQGTATMPRSRLVDVTQSLLLPPQKVFPIQVGDKLFSLSGASISSDAPSYISQYFVEQLRHNKDAAEVRTLYIDRDPATFADIALHLQGYHIEPRDGPHFVKLFTDAQSFSLPRLKARLFSSTIYIRIGDEEFQIPRDLFNSPGDSPNYFSLGYSVFFATPRDPLPGSSPQSPLRPPSILPPTVPGRSSKTFADLLHVLKGYPVEIRNEQHRNELLRDARYYHLKGLEQRLIPHHVSYNLARETAEIVIRLQDLRQSGVSFVADSDSADSPNPASPASSSSTTNPGPGWVYYQRPYVDSEASSLIIEIDDEETAVLTLSPRRASSSPAAATTGQITFHRQTLARITSLLTVIANKMSLPVTQPLGLRMLDRGAATSASPSVEAPSPPAGPGSTGLSEEDVKVRIGADAEVTLNGRAWRISLAQGEDAEAEEESPMDVDDTTGQASSSVARGKKRKLDDNDDGNDDEKSEGEEWIVRKAQWRLRVQVAPSSISGLEVVLGAVKIDAFTNERARNAARGFLG